MFSRGTHTCFILPDPRCAGRLERIVVFLLLLFNEPAMWHLFPRWAVRIHTKIGLKKQI